MSDRPPKPTEGDIKVARKSCSCSTCICFTRAEWENDKLRDILRWAIPLLPSKAERTHAELLLEEIDR